MRRIVGLCVLVGAAGACTPVDRWSAFEEDLHRKIAEQARREGPVEIPASAQPAFEAASAVPLPTDGSPLALTVEDAVFMVMRNNRDLKVEQLNPVIAGTFEQIERGRFDPEFFSSFEYAKERASEVARSTGEQFSVEAEDQVGEVGVRQTLPTGTDIETNVTFERNTSNRAPEQQEARVGLTVTQALLEGFGPAVNLASVRQAELEGLASQYELRGFTEALVAETERAYWRFVLADREIAIFERSLDVARQQLDEIEQRIAVGTLAESQAAPARAEVARREQALIDARSEREAQRLRLVRLLNPAPGGDLSLPLRADTDPSLTPEPVDDMPDRLRLAERLRPDLNEARLRLDQNRLETIITRNGLLPRLDVFLALGKTGFGNTFASTFDELDNGTYDFAAGVRFSQFLGNREARARDLAARASRQQAAAAVANLQQSVRLDVRLAVNQLERARQQITASAVTRALEELTVQAERERFDVGASTALLVAQAQRDLLAAEIAEVRSIVGYRVALVDLYLAEGSLLERRGIRIGPAPRW